MYYIIKKYSTIYEYNAYASIFFLAVLLWHISQYRLDDSWYQGLHAIQQQKTDLCHNTNRNTITFCTIQVPLNVQWCFCAIYKLL